MTKPIRARERLLTEAFHPDWNTGPAAVFASTAARHVRRRRRVRAATAALGAGVALVAMGFLTLQTPAPRVPTHAPSRSYEVISDAQLLDLLKYESVIVVADHSGKKKVIWLAETSSASAPPPSVEEAELL